jgi:hypothetical protein
MSPSSNPPASGLLARLTGIVVGPRGALDAAIHAGPGAVAATWAAVLVVWLAAAGALLSSPIGRQALVDERVRVVEALGGSVDDARYQAWQADPPYLTYFTSGGRVLLLPPTTLAVATALFLWARRHARGVRYLAALSVAVHASVVLAVQQVVATPLHLVRESLTSPFNLAALLPFFDEGSLAARVLGTVELFGLWWAGLLALGAATLTGRQARAYAGPVLGTYLGVAAAVAGVVVLMGGS